MAVSDKKDGPKREAILDAALSLFAERGFHGTAVPLVAERAGCGAGTVYRYFESKEALANALFQQWKTAFSASILAGIDIDCPLEEQFGVIWGRILAFYRAHPIALRFLELHNHHGYLDDKSLLVEQRALGPIREFVAAAQKRGVLRPMAPELLMAIVFGAYLGLIRAAEGGFLELTEKVANDAQAALWRAIAAED